jgi:glycosyltransferase 2 family protein
MISRLSQHQQRILQFTGTILAVVLLLLLLKEGGWEGIISSMRQIEMMDLIWVLMLFLVSRTATICRWHTLLRSGGVNIRFRDTALLTFTGLFASNFLPSTIGGDVVRLAGIMQMGFDRAICLASIAADRLVGMLGMFMAVPIGVMYSWPLLTASPADLSLIGFIQRPIHFLKRTVSTFSIWLKKPGYLFLSLMFTWVHMTCIFGSIYVFVDDLGTPVSFWMIAGLWSLTYFITLIPISINGYGLQELSFTFLFSNVAGASPAMSLTVVILLRAYFIISSLPGAIFLPSALAAMAEKRLVLKNGGLK